MTGELGSMFLKRTSNSASKPSKIATKLCFSLSSRSRITGSDGAYPESLRHCSFRFLTIGGRVNEISSSSFSRLFMMS